ncbi:uncharacterized protein K441DRAFT_543743 [Cenococcum geophilum 1.58]|uniref:uncharacterized protein n=1 Tax=Cenococcum geophilum 1.58 TaxID=794803 RepID=UPI00358FDC68|nr:hypothetical protein K441DRAFT_543743 [Cenococcum geophilum 1.58]
MSCLLRSFFRRRGNAIGSRDGSFQVDEEDLRPRRVLVRTSTEKATGIPSHRRSFTPSRDTLVDEKIALNRSPETTTVSYVDETLLYADDEEEVMTSTYLSEKHLEASTDYTNDECTITGRQEDTIAQDTRWHRRGVIFKPKSKLSKGALEAQHTGDELQRRMDFARSVKNMNEKDAQRAWAAEKERQRKWDDEYKRARQQRSQ